MPVSGARWGLAASAGAAGAFFALGFFFSPVAEAPPQALVHVDMKNRIFFSPPCRQISSEYGITTLENARKIGLTPEPACVDQGGFAQRQRSYSARLLETVGLLAPLPSRWNASGSWNW